jgi:hypothetical protein
MVHASPGRDDGPGSTDTGWSVEHRTRPYDLDAVLADLAAGDHAVRPLLIEKLTTPWG